VVAIEARKHATTDTEAGAATATGESAMTATAVPQRSRAAVVTLGARRQVALPADERPAPSVRDYDQLLTRGAPRPPTGPSADRDTTTAGTRVAGQTRNP
jgi:hypothetical protein